LIVNHSYFDYYHAAPTETYTLSLHDALPICDHRSVHDAARGLRLRAHDRMVAARRPGLLPRVLSVDQRWVVRDGSSHGGRRAGQIGRAHAELQSRENLVCRLLLEKKKN